MRPGGLRHGLVGLLVFIHVLNACTRGSSYPDDLREDLSRESLCDAVTQSLKFLAGVPGDRVVAEWPRRITAEDLRRTLVDFHGIVARADERGSAHWLERVARQFDFYPAQGSEGSDDPLFTGYYEPLLAASLTKTGAYRYPLYAVPKGRGRGVEELTTLSRRDIDILGKLAGRGYEIAWLKDPVDRFFLHVQGSGLLELTDGNRMHVGFAASNERPYTSIGEVLINTGKLDPDTLSMQSIRRYLAEHPDEMDELFAKNERYVFFKVEDQGPLGSLGVRLTPGRSIATDSGKYPEGGLAFIETELPVLDADNHLIAWRRTGRFVLNQDTGAAIQGPRRVDLYFGSGPKAGAAAGLMKRRGKLYFLLRKENSG